MASSPLHELVWSTDKGGLGLRYADSSSAEKKASLLWDTESFNIKVSPKQDSDHAEGKLEPVQLELNPEINHPDSVNSEKSLRSHGNNSMAGSHEDMGQFHKMEESIVDSKQVGFSASNEIEVSSISPIYNKDNVDILSHEADKYDHIPVKDFILGPDNENRSTDSLLCNLQNLRPDIEEVETKSEPSTKFRSFMKSESSPGRSGCGFVNLALEHEEERILQCSFSGESQDFGGTYIEAGVVAESQPREKGEVGRLASHKDNNSAISGNLLSSRVCHQDMRKGDRVEGSGGNLLLSTRKRAWNFYTEMAFGGKKLKTQSNRNYFQGSTYGQDGSFTNWVSTMMHGFRSDQAASLSTLIPQPSHTRQNIHSLLMPHGKNKKTSYSGLLSTFQTYYPPSSTIQYNTYSNLDLVMEDVSLDIAVHEHTTSSEIFEKGSLQIVSQGGGTKFHNHVCTSSERLGHGIIPLEEFPSTGLTNNCDYQEKLKDNIGEYCNLAGIGSPSAFPPNDSGFPEGKGTGTSSFLTNSSGKLVIDNRRYLKSLWITRLCPKLSAPNPIHYNQGIRATDMSTNSCNIIDPPSQNDFVSTKESNCHSSVKLENKRIVMSGEKEVSSIFPTSSYSPSEIDANRKFKPIMKDMLPSQSFQRLKSTEVPNDAFCSDMTCFFCGKSSHDLEGCSELVESELMDSDKMDYDDHSTKEDRLDSTTSVRPSTTSFIENESQGNQT